MFQISTNISALSVEQRKALAEFILSFPTSNMVPFEGEELAELPSFTAYSEDPSPEEAFAPGPILVAASPTVTTPPPPVTDVSLDKSGIPWDSRIHTSSRAKNADGSWRRRRGIDDAAALQVEGELKALMGLPVPVAVVPTPPLTAAAIPAPPPPTVPGPVVVPSEGRAAYIAFVGKASGLMQAKKITQEQLLTAVKSVGVESVPLLCHRYDLIPQVDAALDMLIAS
jgi:hypothetical protein